MEPTPHHIGDVEGSATGESVVVRSTISRRQAGGGAIARTDRNEFQRSESRKTNACGCFGTRQLSYASSQQAGSG